MSAMNRRDFLSRFLQTAAGAAIAHTLDVDKLLWVAGERTIFIPQPRGIIAPGTFVYLNTIGQIFTARDLAQPIFGVATTVFREGDVFIQTRGQVVQYGCSATRYQTL